MRSQRFIAHALSLLTLSITVTAQAIPIPSPPQLNAKSYVLMDADSGQVPPVLWDG